MPVIAPSVRGLDRIYANSPQPVSDYQAATSTASAGIAPPPPPSPAPPAPIAPPPAPVSIAAPSLSSWQQKARGAASRYQVDPDIYDRLIGQESGYDEDVIYGRRVSSAGAQGIAQFMPDTARGFGINPLDPDQSLDAGAKYMRQNLDMFGGDYRAALAAYNAGPGTVQALQKRYGAGWEAHLPDETKKYLAIILDGAQGGGYAASAGASADRGGVLPAGSLERGTSTVGAERVSPAEIEADLRSLISRYKTEEERRFLEEQARQARADGYGPEVVYERVKESAKQLKSGTPEIWDREISITKPLSLLGAASAPFELAGEGLATVADPAIDVLPEGVRAPVRRGVELAPGFAFGPSSVGGSVARRVGLLGASVAGGEAAEALGAPQWVGETVAPVLAPAALNAARGRIRGPVVEAVEGDAPHPGSRYGYQGNQAPNFGTSEAEDLRIQNRDKPRLTQAEIDSQSSVRNTYPRIGETDMAEFRLDLADLEPDIDSRIAALQTEIESLPKTGSRYTAAVQELGRLEAQQVFRDIANSSPNAGVALDRVVEVIEDRIDHFRRIPRTARDVAFERELDKLWDNPNPRLHDAPPLPPRPPGSGTAGEPPMSEGDAVLALRRALREGKGLERLETVKAGRRSQAQRIGTMLQAGEAAGAQGAELARVAGMAGAGRILPTDGLGFKLPDSAIDPLIDKAMRMRAEGKLSIFEAVYNIPRALDEGRRLGPTPAQARLLARLTDIDEAEFGPYMRKRRTADATSKAEIDAEVAEIGKDAPGAVRAQLQAARRAELNADRAERLGNTERAEMLRERAAEHTAKAERLQTRSDEAARLNEITRLGRQIDAEVERLGRNQRALEGFRDTEIAKNAKALEEFKTRYLKRQAKIEEMRARRTQREVESAQRAFDRAQEMNPGRAALQERETAQRLISQMAPPDTSPERIIANARERIDDLRATAGLSREDANTALDILDYHMRGNRAILDSIRDAEGVGQLASSVRAVLSGELADSHLTALVYRNMALKHALGEAGLSDAMVKKVANGAMNAELKLRYGDTVPDGILGELEKMKSTQKVEAINQFTQRWKNMVFGIDAGVFGVQVRTALRRGGVNMLAGMVNRILAAHNLPHVDTHTLDVALSKRLRNIVDGVHVGMGNSPINAESGTLLSYLGPAGRAVDDKIAPVLDRINRYSFGNVMGWVGDNAYEGNLVMLHLLGRDIKNPAVRAQAASVSNHIKSFANQALRAGRGAGEKALLTSPAMTRSQVANLLDMSKLLRPTATPEQRVLAATLIASQAVFYLTMGKLLNDQIGLTDFVFNPGEKGFGQIVTPWKDEKGNNRVIDTMPQASLERAIGRSFEALMEGDEEAAARSWQQYFSGRASVGGRAALALSGVGFSPTRGFVTDLTRDERLSQIAPLPPIIASALSEGFDAGTAALDFLGVSSFPEGITSLRDREAQSRFGAGYGSLLPTQQAEIDALPSVTNTRSQMPQSDYSIARDRRLANFTSEQQGIEQAWQQGNLSQPLPDLLRDLKARRYQTLQDLRDDHESYFKQFKGGPHDSTLEIFYGITFKNPDGTVDWEKTIPAREAYIEELGKRDNAERVWLEDFLGLQQTKKSAVEQELSAYNDRREELGYFAEDADREALDRANPDIDVQTWRFYGGVTDKKAHPDPVLNSYAAVEQALALNLPNRPVKLQGLARPVNQDESTLRAWQASGKIITNFDEQAIPQLRDPMSLRMYKKRFDDLTDYEQSAVITQIRNQAREQVPLFDAWLAYWGATETVRSAATVPFLNEITQAYGFTPPKEDWQGLRIAR